MALMRGLVAAGGAAVDVPVEGAAEVVGQWVLRRVERDPVDPRYRVVARSHVDLAELAAELDLRLRVEVQAAEHEHAVLLERVHDRARERSSVSSLFDVDADDLGADACR